MRFHIISSGDKKLYRKKSAREIEMIKKIIILLFFIIATTEVYAGNDQIIHIEEDLKLKLLTKNVWIHISKINMEKWGTVSANGMAIITNKLLIIIDTPWNDRQTRLLVEWFQKKYDIEGVQLIAGHYHQDNLGGLKWIHQNGFESHSIKRTQEICQMNGLPMPKNILSNTHKFDFQEIPIEVQFIGEGHTEDNICVYLPEQKILFGGCSVKALGNTSLGNIADANIKEWPATLREMKRVYPEAVIVIPGHGSEGNISLLDHTLTLF
jgi:metallo-beta-lactamase class B